MTINTDNEITVDASDAGTGYSTGVNAMGTLTLTKAGRMTVKWNGNSGAPFYPTNKSFSDTDHAINVDKANRYASYRFGTPHTVEVVNGTLTGPGVLNAKSSGKFLENDTVSITPYERKGKSGEDIPFKGWTSSDVTLSSPTTAANSFTVPNKDVTVTAKHDPFDGAPTFTPTGTTNTEGTLTFKTVVRLGDGTECFYLAKDGEQNDESKYKSFRTDTSTSISPYEHSYETRSLPGGNQVDEGDYYVVEYLNGKYYLSEKFTVNYTAAPTPTAAVDDVTITGTTGTVIANKDVVITLTNDTFESTLSGNWITNLPTGLSQSVSRTDDTHAKITVSGNPSVASSAELVIKIPAANLVTSTSDLDVASNANAKYNITAPTNSVNIVAGANMNTTGTANQTGLTGAMTDVVYTADTGYYFPTSYSSIGTSDGVTVTRDSYTQITVSGTPTGNVNITLADATAKTKEATPTATFAATGPDSGTLSGVDSGLQYQINSGAWTDITSTADVTLTGLSACTINVVKKGNGTTTTDSTAQTITVTKAATPSTVTAVDCTAAGNDGKLQNVTTAMEYQKSGDPAWTTCSGTEVIGLTNGTYLVRVKATGTVLASDSQSVIINAYGMVPAAEPNASFSATGRDAGTLEISGTYTSTMKYSVDGGIVWKNVTSDRMPITGVTAAKGIQVKDVGDGITTSESSVKNITVTEGTKPTGLTVTQPSTIGGKGKIETDTSHEYNTNGSTTFTPCTGALDNLTVGDYYVRVKAAGTMLASETATYTITAFTATQETQPAAIFAAIGPDSGTLSGLVSGSNYAVTGAATANFTASGTTHDLNGVSAGALSIVKKGNGTTTTDSTAQTITVTKAATPSTVTAVGCTTSSNNDGKLQNVTTAMEHQKSGTAIWTDCSGTEVSGLTNGTYLVRVKATGTTLASDSQSVVIAAYVAPTEYTITFNVNGGSGTIPSQTTSGQKLSSLPMVLQFLQYGGMDRESEAVFRMRIDARNGANADDLCRWLQGYSPVFRP